jgi:hypothetical protein
MILKNIVLAGVCLLLEGARAVVALLNFFDFNHLSPIYTNVKAVAERCTATGRRSAPGTGPSERPANVCPMLGI